MDDRIVNIVAEARELLDRVRSIINIAANNHGAGRLQAPADKQRHNYIYSTVIIFIVDYC